MIPFLDKIVPVKPLSQQRRRRTIIISLIFVLPALYQLDTQSGLYLWLVRWEGQTFGRADELTTFMITFLAPLVALMLVWRLVGLIVKATTGKTLPDLFGRTPPA